MAKMTKKDILDFLKNNKKMMEENFGVTKIGVFGSFAGGKEDKTSDIDIAVELINKNKFDNYFNLKYFLEENLKEEIDLCVESAIKPIARERIAAEIIYA